ncbi:MAG: hypothetical protein KGZ97_09780 [Bacteroidetes bacterium]|nr:hypothetical protein [Bacteroidota bacterium]
MEDEQIKDVVEEVKTRLDELSADFLVETAWKKEDAVTLMKELLVVESACKQRIAEKRKEFKTLKTEAERRANWAVRKDYEHRIKIIHSNYLCVLETTRPHKK